MKNVVIRVTCSPQGDQQRPDIWESAKNLETENELCINDSIMIVKNVSMRWSMTAFIKERIAGTRHQSRFLLRFAIRTDHFTRVGRTAR